MRCASCTRLAVGRPLAVASLVACTGCASMIARQVLPELLAQGRARRSAETRPAAQRTAQRTAPPVWPKEVVDKQDPNVLVASDRSECAVSRDTYDKTLVGERTWCLWVLPQPAAAAADAHEPREREARETSDWRRRTSAVLNSGRSSVKSVSHRARSYAVAGALLIGAAGTGSAQSVHVGTNAPDSVARVTARQTVRRAIAGIATRDSVSMLLLTDSTVVLQLTDRGIERLSRDASRKLDENAGLGVRLVSGMLGGLVRPLLDHAIEYQLRDLEDARFENGRLMLLRQNGDEVFRDVEIQGTRVLQGFSERDGRAFAARVRAARAALR